MNDVAAAARARVSGGACSTGGPEGGAKGEGGWSGGVDARRVEQQPALAKTVHAEARVVLAVRGVRPEALALLAFLQQLCQLEAGDGRRKLALRVDLGARGLARLPRWAGWWRGGATVAG